MTEWRTIPGFDNAYVVSSDGEVYSAYKRDTLNINYNKQDGYGRVCINHNVMLIHRVVAMAFLDLKDGYNINHIDGDKQNNRLSNLEAVTQSENAIHCAYHISGLTKAKQPPDKNTVIELHNNGYGYGKIAKMMGVSKTTIRNILKTDKKDSEKRFDFEVLEGETVKLIPGYTCYYASDYGRILSTKSGNALKPQIQPNGYVKVNLIENAHRDRQYIHRLIALTFFGKSDLVVNHIDGNRQNNTLSNLEYVTQSENVKKCHIRKLTESDKDEIRRLKTLGYHREVLGKMFGVTKYYINTICRNKK
ncbi:MAG: HNH endonuclease [Candidatus Paceibacterota bacterium]